MSNDDARNMTPEERISAQGPGMQAFSQDEIKRRDIERAPLMQNAYRPEMSNRERAMDIVKPFYKQSLGDIDLTLMIERALDEAEKRGEKNRCDLGFNEGFIAGQKEMRERAEKAAEHFDNGKNELIQDDTARVISDAIRGLLIDGE